MDKLVLIDGHSILNRAFYGVPDLTNSEGLHTNAVYGFLNIMFKILEEEKADHLAVAFDLKEPTFRHKMYDAYKGTRKPMPEELHQQVDLMKEVLTAMGIPILTLPGYEADDILGTVAKKSQSQGIDVAVVSGDRDLLQLSDEHIKLRIPKTSRGGTEVKDYYPEDVKLSLIHIYQYGCLYDALLEQGIRLINSPEEYRLCHEFPNVYPHIKGSTPRMTVFKQDEPVDWQEIRRQYGRFLIKDYVKSVKGSDFPVYFDAGYTDRQLDGYLERFKELRGNLFDGGIVIKEYADLARCV